MNSWFTVAADATVVVVVGCCCWLAGWWAKRHHRCQVTKLARANDCCSGNTFFTVEAMAVAHLLWKSFTCSKLFTCVLLGGFCLQAWWRDLKHSLVANRVQKKKENEKTLNSGSLFNGDPQLQILSGKSCCNSNREGGSKKSRAQLRSSLQIIRMLSLLCNG